MHCINSCMLRSDRKLSLLPNLIVSVIGLVLFNDGRLALDDGGPIEVSRSQNSW